MNKNKYIFERKDGKKISHIQQIQLQEFLEKINFDQILLQISIEQLAYGCNYKETPTFKKIQEELK